MLTLVSTRTTAALLRCSDTVAATARTTARAAAGRLSWSVVAALAGAAGVAVAAIGWARNRCALARAADELRAERTDALTGLATRRVWQTIASARVGAPDQELWVVLVDLDELKPINDTYGHAAGDAVLEVTALRLCTAMPTPVYPGRLGGDEFAVLVESPVAGWRQRLDAHLAQPVLLDEHDPASAIPVRASIGAAEVPSAGGDLSELLSAADARMYQTKTSRHTSNVAGRRRLRDPDRGNRRG